MSKQLSQLSLNSQNLRKTSAAHIARARKMRADLGRVKERSAILIANSRAIVGRFLSSKDAERGAALGCEDSPSRDLLSVVEQLKTRRSATVAGGAAPTIYVGFFWDERHQSVTFHFTSGDLIEAIILAYDHLRNARVHDPYFREFLLDRLQSWERRGRSYDDARRWKADAFQHAIRFCRRRTPCCPRGLVFVAHRAYSTLLEGPVFSTACLKRSGSSSRVLRLVQRDVLSVLPKRAIVGRFRGQQRLP